MSYYPKPKVKKEPTFLGNKMRWVGTEKDGKSYFGGCWKYVSPSKRMIVRAWPAGPNTNCPDEWDFAEVIIWFKDIALYDLCESDFVAGKNEENDLEKQIKKAERAVKKAYFRVISMHDLRVIWIRPKKL